MMTRFLILPVIGCLLMSPSPVKTCEVLRLYNPASSWGARFATLIHKFRELRRPSTADNMIIYANENYYFNGTANDLNRFLNGVAELPRRRKVTVAFAGPDAGRLGRPLTFAAAQAGVDFDWHVQVIQGDVYILIPLAARIPFSEITVPKTLRVETAPGAPRAASVFARLQNAAIKSRSVTPPNAAKRIHSGAQPIGLDR